MLLNFFTIKEYQRYYTQARAAGDEIETELKIEQEEKSKKNNYTPCEIDVREKLLKQPDTEPDTQELDDQKNDLENQVINFFNNLENTDGELDSYTDFS